MTIDLSDRERAVLVRALEAQLAAVRREASRIERARDAAPLWEDEHVLEAFLGRLKG